MTMKMETSGSATDTRVSTRWPPPEFGPATFVELLDLSRSCSEGASPARLRRRTWLPLRMDWILLAAKCASMLSFAKKAATETAQEKSTRRLDERSWCSCTTRTSRKQMSTDGEKAAPAQMKAKEGKRPCASSAHRGGTLPTLARARTRITPYRMTVEKQSVPKSVSIESVQLSSEGSNSGCEQSSDSVC
jgi:hypothetical protein